MTRQHELKSTNAKIDIETLLNYSELDYTMFGGTKFDYLYIGNFKNGEIHGYGIEVSRDEKS